MDQARIIGYVPGVFDLLHRGHIAIVDAAILRCDRLVIGVHTDTFTASYKRVPKQSQAVRCQQLQTRYPTVTIVVVGLSHLAVISELGVTHIFHGTDWELEDYKRQIRYVEDGLTAKIELLPYTVGISTTELLQVGVQWATIRYFWFDLDNTLMLNGIATDGAVVLVRGLQQCGYTVRVITNNNFYTPIQISHRLSQAGIQIAESQIYSPLVQAVSILSEFQNVFVWGSAVATNYLCAHGVKITSTIEVSDCILVLHHRFTYTELTVLLTALHTRPIPYIVGNIDIRYPDRTDVLVDTGMVAAMIEMVVGRSPAGYLGKPGCLIPLAGDASEYLMIGDSLLTDGVLASNLGIGFFHVTPTHPLDLLLGLIS